MSSVKSTEEDAVVLDRERRTFQLPKLNSKQSKLLDLPLGRNVYIAGVSSTSMMTKRIPMETSSMLAKNKKKGLVSRRRTPDSDPAVATTIEGHKDYNPYIPDFIKFDEMNQSGQTLDEKSPTWKKLGQISIPLASSAAAIILNTALQESLDPEQVVEREARRSSEHLRLKTESDNL